MNGQILERLSYGLYALGVKGEAGPSACIVNAVFQVTAQPACVALSINLDSYSCECIQKNGVYTISIFSEQTKPLTISALGFSSGRNVNKLAKVSHFMLDNGLPVVDDQICGWFQIKVTNQMEASTHRIYLGEMVDACDELQKKEPMTYDYYHRVIKGKTSKAAPTYVAEKQSF